MSLFGRQGFVDGDQLEVAGAAVRLKVNARSRRGAVGLGRARGEIAATAPSPRRLAEAAAFARERASWIAERLAELPEVNPLVPGQLIEVFGRPVRLEAGSGRARWIEPIDGSTPRITAMADGTHGGEGFTRAVILVIRKKALEVLSERTAHY